MKSNRFMTVYTNEQQFFKFRDGEISVVENKYNPNIHTISFQVRSSSVQRWMKGYEVMKDKPYSFYLYPSAWVYMKELKYLREI